MASHKIRFLPDGKTVDVEAGTTLMEAAQKEEVQINNLCGGKGVCGRCRVKVANGKIRADKHSISLLSKEEILEGYVLACQTKVDSDMEILIPAESRMEEGQILMECTAVDYSAPEKIALHRVPSDPLCLYGPLTQKVFLEMREPSPDDNVSDMDRIIRELRRKTQYRDFEISLPCLQGLAMKLRKNAWKATATLAKHGDIGRILQIEAGDMSERNYGLAVDVGTTTVVAQLVHLKSGNVLGVAGSHNMQTRFGEDVISRMIYACGKDDGLHPLHQAIIKNINQLIKTLTEEKGIDPRDITAVAAAGNTTMSHLLLSLIPCSIRVDPYVPTANVYPQVHAGELGIDIHPEGIVEVVPGVASYVGGDIVAGIIACGIADRPETRVLIDVGTNGEIAIGNNEWMVCCSASAGPAFEGGGIKHGMRATRGAIEKLIISDGRVEYKSIGKGKLKGICGSGLIDCLYELARNHIIDGEGKFHLSAHDERLVDKDGEIQFILAPAGETETGKEIVITQSDISHLIRSKGAVFAAIKSLMDYVGLKLDAIDTFFVAGGFGSYLDIPKAIGIGLLPDIERSRIKFVGNSSLMGARMCLLSAHTMERAGQIARSTTNIELSNYQPFMDEYVAAMFLPHTDRRLFPSVDY
jgi:uncharacterized 2Fe-2S/4Fe-4S cluster protein (DUF4445 family)